MNSKPDDATKEENKVNESHSACDQSTQTENYQSLVKEPSEQDVIKEEGETLPHQSNNETEVWLSMLPDFIITYSLMFISNRKCHIQSWLFTLCIHDAIFSNWLHFPTSIFVPSKDVFLRKELKWVHDTWQIGFVWQSVWRVLKTGRLKSACSKVRLHPSFDKVKDSKSESNEMKTKTQAKITSNWSNKSSSVKDIAFGEMSTKIRE